MLFISLLLFVCPYHLVTRAHVPVARRGTRFGSALARRVAASASSGAVLDIALGCLAMAHDLIRSTFLGHDTLATACGL